MQVRIPLTLDGRSAGYVSFHVEDADLLTGRVVEVRCEPQELRAAILERFWGNEDLPEPVAVYGYATRLDGALDLVVAGLEAVQREWPGLGFEVPALVERGVILPGGAVT